MTAGKTWSSPSSRATCSTSDISETGSRTPQWSIPLIASRHGRSQLSRRRLLTHAALAAGGLVTGLLPRAVAAAVRVDITQGNVQPMPIALPDFLAGAPSDTDVARNVTGHHRAICSARGLFAPIDPRRLHREDHRHRRRAALCRLARHQRAGAGHGPYHHAAGRTAQSRFPAVGRVRGPAADRQAVFHHARQLAPHRPHHLRRRSTSG